MGLRGPKPRTFEQILTILEANSIVDEQTGCVLWQGHTAGDNYGVICWQGKQTYIHRLIYKQEYKEEPEVIRHTCDNPRCWNHFHLRNGTHADNVDDKVAKQRHDFGSKHYKAVLDEDKVREIRTSELTPVQLATKYNIHRAVIHDVINRKTWKHV